MVSPFPPLRDGVGKYAAQEVADLRAQGHEVEVLAPVPCAAHHVEDLKGGFKLLKLRRYARRYDRVILQYQPSHYHLTGSGPRRIRSNIGMWLTFRLVRNLTVVCHEIEYPPPSWPRWRPETIFERKAWKGVAEVVFHTEAEVGSLREHFRAEPRKVVLRDHGEYFRPAAVEDQPTARRRLGLAETGPLFLCIGFIQRHKGFDRAIRAFRRVPGDDARLVVIGSVRSGDLEHLRHLEELRRLARGDARVTVKETMLSDEEFDRWIVAADVVVLPYRQIWSSGVLERAKLLDRPVVATDVGGMAEQARPTDRIVADEDGMAHAMAALTGREVGDAAAVQGLSVEEARAHVRGEAQRLRSGVGTSRAAAGDRLAGLVNRLDDAKGVHPVVLPSSRPLVGPFLTVAKRSLQRGIGWYIVPMLGRLNEYQNVTVETLSAVAGEVAALREDAEVFRAGLESVAKRDTEAAEALSRLADGMGLLGGRMEAVERTANQLERRTRTMIEQIGSAPAPAPPGPSPDGEPEPRPAPRASGADAYTTFDYFGFESHFRGDPAVIKRDQREAYLADFTGAAPVLDVGCGRGEFLEVLREAGVEARGVDVDLDMVAACRGKGLEVAHGDAIEYLRGLPEGSLGGIIAAQVVEHLPPRTLVALLAASRRALRPGGVLVCETINPQSLFALANWYMMDLTHAQPVHPNTLRFLAAQEGFGDLDVRYRSPARPEDPELTVAADAPDWARAFATVLTEELRELNRVVFGPQDYALVARVPDTASAPPATERESG